VLIKSFEVTDPHRVGKIEVELHGRIKDCKALTYRQDLRAKEIEQYRVRMLPTRQVFAYLLILMSLSLFFLANLIYSQLHVLLLFSPL
jgi:ribosomal protein S8